MENSQTTAVAEIATMQYLLNAVLDKVELRQDVTDGTDRQETVCFNTIVDVFGGK